jgi:hypothetical protein
LSHGEGGLYKEDDPSDINEAMTARMVNKAALEWEWDKPATHAMSLTVLSDALHQAEDRGSHGEGRQFTGHDVRLGVTKWAKKYKRALQSWEAWPAHAPKEALEGNWQPDNFSVNARGGVLGVRFAQGALKKFANYLAPEEYEGTIPGPAQMPTKRFARAKKWMWWQSKSSGPGAKMLPMAKTGKGSTMGKKGGALKKLMEQEQLLVSEEERKKASQTPHQKSKFREGGEQHKRFMEGYAFYKTGAGITEAFTKAEAQFRTWGKSYLKKGGKKKGERSRLSKRYYIKETSGLKGEALRMAARAILKAYEQVFHVPLYQEGQLPQEELNK